ncbi:hypothetical protein G6F68_015901 [Rhizopus microsporus]|nr:hypothetical protein G6F68_015901 [Rhizopus microsporus]
MHVVPPGADLAVHGPYHQRVAAARLQFVQIGQGAGQVVDVARVEGASAHFCGGDRREGCDGVAVARAPERGVRVVQPMARILRHRDGILRMLGGVDEARQPLHVGVRARYRQRRQAGVSGQRIRRQIRLGQVAAIVLRIDDQ